MFQQGSITDEERARLLVLYSLRALGQLIPYDKLVELTIMCAELNFFDFVNEFEALQTTGHLDSFEKDGVKVVCLTPMGEEVLNTLEKRLPYSIREKTSANAAKMLAQMRFKAQVYAETEKTDKGWLVTCNINEQDDVMFKLTLGVANEMQAKSIGEHFEKNPSEIYSSVMQLLVEELNDNK